MTNEAREIMSRAEALARGMNHYFTGKPCKNGGIAPRRVSNWQCCCAACADVGRSAMIDPDLERARQARYRERHRETLRAKGREYAAKNADRAAVRSREWNDRNRDRRRDIERAWRDRNPDKVAHKLAVHGGRRRAAKARAVPGWFSEWDRFVISEAHAAARRRTRATGFAWAVDHIIPLRGETVCGLHVWNNIQVIPSRVNSVKCNRLVYTEPLQWLDFYDGR